MTAPRRCGVGVRRRAEGYGGGGDRSPYIPPTVRLWVWRGWQSRARSPCLSFPCERSSSSSSDDIILQETSLKVDQSADETPHCSGWGGNGDPTTSSPNPTDSCMGLSGPIGTEVPFVDTPYPHEGWLRCVGVPHSLGLPPPCWVWRGGGGCRAGSRLGKPPTHPWSPWGGFLQDGPTGRGENSTSAGRKVGQEKPSPRTAGPLRAAL